MITITWLSLVSGLLALAFMGMASICTVLLPEHKIITTNGYRWLAIIGWFAASCMCLLNLAMWGPR